MYIRKVREKERKGNGPALGSRAGLIMGKHNQNWNTMEETFPEGIEIKMHTLASS